MTPPINIGLIGTSWWAEAMYLPSLQSHPQANLAAICGRNRANTQMIANQYHIPRFFTDYREMIGMEKLDAVVVSTPDDWHHPMVMAALEQNLHVLCEKPLAFTAAEAKEMYETASAKKIKHMTLFTWRWMPHFRYVRDLLAQGFIGRCYQAEFLFQGGYARSRDYAWRFDARRANGVLGDLGSHMIDLARWLVGEISQVQANLGYHVRREKTIENANDSALLILTFENSAHGVINTSAVKHVGDRLMEQQVELHGEKGSLRVEVIFGGPQAGVTVLACAANTDSWQLLPVPDTYWGDVDRTDFGRAMVPGVFTHHAAGARHFIDSILLDRSIEPGFYDGWQTQEIIEQALKCAKTSDFSSPEFRY